MAALGFAEAPAKKSKRPSFFALLYAQVAGVIGALAAMALLSNVIDLGLKGLVAEVFAMWTEKVRPLIGMPLHWAIESLPAWMRFDPPVILKDYLALGFTLWLSTLRSIFMVFGVPQLRWHHVLGEIGAYVLTFFGLVFFWPLAVILMFTDTRDFGNVVSELGEDVETSPFRRVGAGSLRKLRLTFGLAVAPLIYLVLLLAAGHWLA
jgi:hypothetical protein